jgi:DNA-binding NtrC family response regulator
VHTTQAWRVLIISSEANRDIVKSAMSHWGLEPTCCSSFQQARSLLPDETLSLIFCEDRLADGTYRDLLRGFGKPLKTRFVVISPAPELEAAYNEALQLGAFDMIASPCSKSDVQWMIIRAVQEESKRGANRRRTRVEDAPAESPHLEETDGSKGAGKGTSEGGQ